MRIVKGRKMTIMVYFKNLGAMIATHTHHEVMNRCLGLIMGIDWPDVQGPVLRELVGCPEDAEWEKEPSSFEIDSGYSEDESYSE